MAVARTAFAGSPTARRQTSSTTTRRSRGPRSAKSSASSRSTSRPRSASVRWPLPARRRPPGTSDLVTSLVTVESPASRKPAQLSGPHSNRTSRTWRGGRDLKTRPHGAVSCSSAQSGRANGGRLRLVGSSGGAPESSLVQSECDFVTPTSVARADAMNAILPQFRTNGITATLIELLHHWNEHGDARHLRRALLDVLRDLEDGAGST